MTEPPSDREFDLVKDGQKATLAAIERDSRAALERLTVRTIKNRKSGEIAEIKRRAAEDLQCVAIMKEACPPKALVELLVTLLEVKPRQRSVKSREKFLRAAAHMARNPDATASAIRTAIKGDFDTVAKWITDPEFLRLVQIYRAHPRTIPDLPSG